VRFDRSWHDRAGVERVMGFCSPAEHAEFLRSCPEFERMLVRSGIIRIEDKDLIPTPGELPPRPDPAGYVRPPMGDQHFIDELR